MDLKLLHALQMFPRIPWTQLAPILGVDATTLARRWRELREQRLAWTSCYPVTQREWATMPNSVCSLIEVDCIAGQRDAVINEISAHSNVLSVECTSGARDLLLTIVLPSTRDTDNYVNSVLRFVPGVQSTRTYFTRQVLKDGAFWQVNHLSDQERRLVRETKGVSLDIPAGPSKAHYEVLEQLVKDIRMPVSQIAAATGRSLASVSRIIKQLMHARWIRTRVEFSHHLLGWDVSTMLWLKVPPHSVAKITERAAAMPQVRLCATVLNSSNVVITFWLRGFQELDLAEDVLIREIPEVEVMDRWLLPRTAKRLGHLIDIDGRHSGYVPITLEKSKAPHPGY